MDNENYYPIEFNDTGNGFIITNNGTAPAPCVVTFIPKVDFYYLTIEGLTEEPIKMSQIEVGDILIIDGENRTVTVNGENAFDRYDAWEFPKLQPGINNVTIQNGVQADISIEYNPRYI